MSYLTHLLLHVPVQIQFFKELISLFMKYIIKLVKGENERSHNCVKKKCGKLEWMNEEGRVCQGSKLFPLLLTIAMDGIQKDVKARMRGKTCSILFMDDQVI